MGTWAGTSDVAARVAYATISTTSKPTTAQVSTFIDDAESRISNRLRTAAIAIPGASGDAAAELKTYAVDYAVAQTRLVWASASGGEPHDEYAESLLIRFELFLDDVGNRPGHWSGILESGSVGTDSIGLTGTATNDLGERAVTHAEMAPVITRGTEI